VKRRLSKIDVISGIALTRDRSTDSMSINSNNTANNTISNDEETHVRSTGLHPKPPISSSKSSTATKPSHRKIVDESNHSTPKSKVSNLMNDNRLVSSSERNGEC
jgi:hypothetical protein